MENLTIESANRKRNRYLLWIAVFWPILYLPLIVGPYLNGNKYSLILTAITVPTMIVMFVIIARLIRFNNRLRSYPEVARALREEIFFVYQRKALMVGFYTVMVLLVFLVPVSTLVDIPARLLCMGLFFIGISVYLVAWLIYNRD